MVLPGNVRESKHSLKYLTCLRMTRLLFNIIIPPPTSPEEPRWTTEHTQLVTLRTGTDISPATLGPDCHAGFLPHIVKSCCPEPIKSLSSHLLMGQAQDLEPTRQSGTKPDPLPGKPADRWAPCLATMRRARQCPTSA